MRRLLFTALLCAGAAPAAGQDLADYDYEHLTFRGIGFDYGYIWPSKVAAAPMYTLRLDLGYLGPAVRLVPSISYWSSRLRDSELDRLADRIEQLPPLADNGIELTGADLGEILWSDLGLSLDAHVVWTAPLGIITFVGAGASVHALNGRGVTIDDTFVEDLLDSTAAGMAVMAGFEVQPIDRLRLYGEARYTLVSDVRYPALRIGASLMLPPRATAGTSGGNR
ncbi:MAG TPA: hypothetical protein VMN60_12135 [Longimicrobiales bacterium]|nr:hypothetical protein [Longimicrobiales bacterium]